MQPINLGTRADVVIIPPEPGQEAAMARRGGARVPGESITLPQGQGLIEAVLI